MIPNFVHMSNCTVGEANETHSTHALKARDDEHWRHGGVVNDERALVQTGACSCNKVRSIIMAAGTFYHLLHSGICGDDDVDELDTSHGVGGRSECLRTVHLEGL